MTETVGIDKQSAANVSEASAVWMQRVAASMALVIVAIPAMMTAALIWISVGRPLLFRQVRTGKGGRAFTLVKFRTMHDLRGPDGQLLPDRMRETVVTRFIRRLRLDEIPQLLAILNGHMNFVGPRPLQPWTVAEFGPLGAVRNQVRPGLTGWAQVNGNTRLSDADKLALDIWYIDNHSAALNCWIFLLTVAALFRGERIRKKPLALARERLAARSTIAVQARSAAEGGGA
ncbi:sugar transferase [Chelativorans xinjiangense]|uniref:sugar transferase n=1 Tax=Chelativorans xinjiangense TaxID=2681485 RepID=UPI001FEBE210|nr:sugar transferase [Chelativorans xinjiangense]